MKVVLREHGTDRLFVRKVTNVMDVIGENVVGYYPDEDLFHLTTDVELLEAIHRRMAKIGGAEHPINGRVSNKVFGVLGDPPPPPPAPATRVVCEACGELKNGRHTNWLCRLMGRNS